MRRRFWTWTRVAAAGEQALTFTPPSTAGTAASTVLSPGSVSLAFTPPAPISIAASTVLSPGAVPLAFTPPVAMAVSSGVALVPGAVLLAFTSAASVPSIGTIALECLAGLAFSPAIASGFVPSCILVGDLTFTFTPPSAAVGAGASLEGPQFRPWWAKGTNVLFGGDV